MYRKPQSLGSANYCTSAAKAWISFFRQQQEVSQPWREEHNGSAWLSKLQIQMPASFRLFHESQI
jgi:hypothetical protein